MTINPASPTNGAEIPFKFGVIGILGRANAGKSTLINALIGERVSIVSSRPQTTRKRIMGILTWKRNQVVICDTPGLHEIKNKLDAFMAEEIQATLRGLNAAFYLVDASVFSLERDGEYLRLMVPRLTCPLILVINKTDLTPKIDRSELKRLYEKIAKFDACFFISAVRKDGLHGLLTYLEGMLPPGEHTYSEDEYTTLSEREVVEETIREVLLERYRDEIPHSAAVMVNEFKDRGNGKTFVSADIYVERESQKKVVIGSNGAGIKAVGMHARERLNQILGRDIFLELWVKVRTKWRKNEDWVRRLGYKAG